MEHTLVDWHTNHRLAVRIPSVNLKEPKVLAIVGQGYVGLPLAMAAIEAGWSVIGVDKDAAKVALINSGLSPVEDVSNSTLQAALAIGAYKATTDPASVSAATVVTLCVPTPLNDKRQPELALLESATSAIAPYIANETLVVSESTSYPGTLRDIIVPIITALKPKESTVVYFASAPERVNPGDPIWNQKNTPRLIGGINEMSQSKAVEFYGSLCDVALTVSSPEVAEAAKLLENSFRLVNIALINEFTQLCSATGINVQEVVDAATSKPYGFMPFRPGVGVGGHCIPVDPLYLTWWARKNGNKAALIEAADSINQAMPKYVGERALELADPQTRNPRVLILGVSYKPGIGDVRETPALELRNYLLAKGAVVAWHDPLVPIWEGSEPVGLDWNCDVAVVATRQPDMSVDTLLSRGVRILDCTNSFRLTPGVTTI